jgi:hypothetical protein
VQPPGLPSWHFANTYDDSRSPDVANSDGHPLTRRQLEHAVRVDLGALGEMLGAGAHQIVRAMARDGDDKLLVGRRA